MHRSLLALCLVFSISATSIPEEAQAAVQRPKLVVQLVIDQFRADYLLRFSSRFLPAKGKNGEVGGFQYLMNQGAYYPMAEYGILQSMTAPGHATILTGSYPYQAGIPVNDWFDTVNNRSQYCVNDDNFPIVGLTETKARNNHIGISPSNLIGTTVGDELKNAGLPSRVVSIALKDRAAVLLGGHRADLAFWMDREERSWVSSKFYLPDGKLPDWLVAFNAETRPKQGEKVRLEATGEGTGFSAPGYRPTKDRSMIGLNFPHEVDASSKGALALPYGMELTELATERAFDAYKLGRGKSSDLLAVSFSSHDFVGHAFGPNSREMEEMTVAEDRLISKLLNHIRKNLPGGLSQVVIALTADHGAPADPDWLKANRINAGRMDENAISEEIEKALSNKFGESENLKWVAANHSFNLWLNRKTLETRKVSLVDATNVVRDVLTGKPGVAHVLTWKDYQDRKPPPGLLGEQVMRTYFPGRNGDLIIVPKPYWITGAWDTVTHLTGYSYDRMVPLVIVGPGIRAATHPEYARVIDLAPTLSYLLNILPPSLSEGRVLSEAMTLPAGAKR